MIRIWGASDDLVEIATTHLKGDTRYRDLEMHGWELGCYEKSTTVRIVEGPADKPSLGCLVKMRYFGAVGFGCWSAEVCQLDEGIPLPPIRIEHDTRRRGGEAGYSAVVFVESTGHVSWTQEADPEAS